jgi:hypothetical protein
MNEPAFPSKALGGLGYTTGMTLRDYFAAKAMQAQLARTTWGTDDDARNMAGEAYGYADAMMEARNAAQ